jgi:glycosyltransferase involved in cell wall biosynthesis
MKFSIVTISYNQARFLEQAILSVLNQKGVDVEYIVVDPGSSDGSREIIERYRDRIARVFFEPDQGPADGLSKGFQYATGDVYGYLNSDDYFEPGAFGRVAHFFDARPDVDVLNGAIRIVDSGGRARLRTGIADRFDLRRFVAGASWVGQQGTFFRRQAFERSNRFRIENRTCWDGELLVDLALANSRFAVMHSVLGNFRIHSQSISGSNRLNDQYLRDLESIRNRLAEANIAVSPARSAALRVMHRANVIRHFRSLVIR